MHHERTIELRVTNWPRFVQSRTFPLDAEIFDDGEDALRRYARNRFGEGQLVHLGGQRWEYQREIPGPQWWWRLLAFLLNRSYG